VKAPRPAFVIGIPVLALILGACAAGAGSAPNVEEPAPVPVTDGRDTAGQPGVAPDGGGGFVVDPAAEADRSIVKTGEITVEVDNVGETTGAVRALAVELGGYVSSSSQGAKDEMAVITLRIPADQFEEAIAGIHDLDGEIKAEATNQQDVTSSVVDMEAQLANLKAAEEQYRELLGQATKIEDILAIQNQLFQVRGEIESMEAQLKYLNDQAAMATLTVTVTPTPEPVNAATKDFDPGAIVQDAVAWLAAFGQWLVGAAIWFVIVGIPVLLVLGLLVFVGMRIGRRFARSRTKTPPAAPPAAAA
jgi:hypothetical protein